MRQESEYQRLELEVLTGIPRVVDSWKTSQRSISDS